MLCLSLKLEWIFYSWENEKVFDESFGRESAGFDGSEEDEDYRI
jgi:hypothetical protein